MDGSQGAAATAPRGETAVTIALRDVTLNGDLHLASVSRGLVMFAHGSGSSRRSPRNRAVAAILRAGKFATLMLDLLTAREEVIDNETREYRFDIPMLAQRLVGVIDWAAQEPELRPLPIGLFGASTGAGAALIAAAQRPARVSAVVSRGGRPDLAGAALAHVHAPTLLIVGGYDSPVIDLNRDVLPNLNCTKQLTIVPAATHLFEEPGALETVAQLARDWFSLYLVAKHPPVGVVA
jgi:putative phosphoribosyl transferase